MAPAAHLPAERDRVLILDFGSQFTQLIARRIREQHVYCEIHPPTLDVAAVRALTPAGIVLSGGPASVLDPGSPDVDPAHPRARRARCSAICYGMQLLMHRLGGRRSSRRTIASTAARCSSSSATTRCSTASTGAAERDGLDEPRRPRAAPAARLHRARARARARPSPRCAIATQPIWGLLFHPEVVHTDGGAAAARELRARASAAAPAPGRWRPSSTRRSRGSARASARAARCAGSPAASIPRSRRRSCTARSATQLHLHLRRQRPAARRASARRWRRSSARASASSSSPCAPRSASSRRCAA